MKSQNLKWRKLLAASLAAGALLGGIGCAKKGDGFSASTPTDSTTSTADENNAPGVETRDVDGPRGSAFSAGATAFLSGTDLATLTSYVAIHPLNSPTDLKISVKLKEIATDANQYAGTVFISYYDNGRYYTAEFTTDDLKNPDSGTLFPGWNHAFYNNWYSLNGKAVFHGFFQDSYGAVMLVIDDAIDQGDGAGATLVSGSVWFKNYPSNQAQINPQGIPCWFITAGPYDCRTLLVSGGWQGDGVVSSTSALTPDLSKYWTSRSTHPYHEEDPRRGWRKLGTFSNLNKAKAFSQ